TTQEGMNADPLLAWGHVDDGSRYAAQPMFLRPAGQFTTTAADLAQFAKFLLSDGNVRGQPFVSAELMRARGRVSGTQAASNGLTAGYALGLGRRDRHGVVGYCHGGNIVGFVAMLCVFPEQGKAFAYAVNTDSETADYGRIQSVLIDALAVAQAEAPATVAPAADIADWYGHYILSPNRFQAFEYLDTVFGGVRISRDADALVMTSLQADPRHLRPVAQRTYSSHDRTTASHVFFQDNTQHYLFSDGFQTYEKVSLLFVIAHRASVAMGVAGFLWLFCSGVWSVVRTGHRMFATAQAPAFVALLLVFVPVPFFMTQSFMALGDVTAASMLLAIVTVLLPIGMLLTVVRAWRLLDASHWNAIHLAAALFSLQWCGVLIAAGMLPLRLWA
ncbi:MAG: serine hydrolase, partial [Pseudomonadota bacterium]